MNCTEFMPLADPHADGELDLVRSLELEKHLATCPTCSSKYERIKAAKTIVATSGLYFEAPVELKRRIRNQLNLNPSNVNRDPWWRLSWFGLAVPAAFCAIVAGLFLWAVTSESTEDLLVREITAGHVRSLMVNHKTDVASSDQHTVKPWFDGKLDFAPPVLDLADRGFPLVGGRLDYLQNRPVAALVYQRHQHFINLFVWPAPANSATSETTASLHGYNLVHWTHSGMNFWAISDLNRAELGDFARLVR